jgi:deoxyribose-phosphate aldolase
MIMEDAIARARSLVDAELGPVGSIDRPRALRDAASLAGRIDHTLLGAAATSSEIVRVCHEAREHAFASVCVNSRWVPLVAAELAGSGVLTCSVVGFPLGAMASQAKADETALAVAGGADEIDMVISVGDLKEGNLHGVHDDIRAVVIAAQGRPVKVIIETCLLDDVQKAVACEIAARAGAAYVKTSTGMSTGGATAADVALMRAVVGDDLGVKASGGIRTTQDAVAMIAAGADRIGASASIAIASGELPADGASAGGY